MLNITLATFFVVFLRGLQQQNVIHGNYILAGLTPFLMAVAEVASVLYMVELGWPAVPWVGVGGSAGITLSMLAHKKLARKKWFK